MTFAFPVIRILCREWAQKRVYERRFMGSSGAGRGEVVEREIAKLPTVMYEATKVRITK